MEYLPHDISLDILSRLPVTSLLQCKLVCRAWKHLAQDPLLVSIHFSSTDENEPCLILHCNHPIRNQIYSLELSAHNDDSQRVNKIRVPTLPEFVVVGSCKGLLCLCDSLTKKSVYIYNPFTRDSIELPKSVEFRNQDVVFGFSYHQATKEYKVIKVVYSRVLRRPFLPFRYIGMISPESEVQILDTLGSPAWRSKGTIPYRLHQGPSQVLVNGRLHWSTWPQRYRPSCSFISFDLADEQFRVVPKPDCDELHRCNFDLVVLGGCLSVTFQLSFGQFEIWVMKEYDVKESWIKEFSIGVQVPRGLEQDVAQSSRGSKFYRSRSFVRVLCLLKNGEILLLVEYKCRALVSYDPKNGTFKNLSFHGMPNWFEAFVHEGNLAFINT